MIEVIEVRRLIWHLFEYLPPPPLPPPPFSPPLPLILSLSPLPHSFFDNFMPLNFNPTMTAFSL